MRLSLAVAVSLLAALALVSCEGPSSPAEGPADPETAFSHATTADISGYYVPTEPVRFGQWSFDHLFVGQASEFETWEGGSRADAFGPVMLQFDDATSPMVATELGEAHSVTTRVLPTRYQVTDTAVTFEGRSPELGQVAFEGRLDPDALAVSRRNLGGDGVVMTGTLTAGGRTVRNISLRWWMGD